MKTAALLVAILASGTPTPLANVLAPAGKWTIAYEERQCIASRDFGEAGAPTMFVLRPYLGSTEEQIVLILPPSADRTKRRGKGTVVLHPSGRRFPMQYASGPVSENRRGINVDIDNAGIRDQMAAVTELSIEGDKRAVTLQMAGFASVARALKTCEDDLLRSWGADPAAMTVLAPNAPVATWFSRDSYPRAALQARETGHVIAMVTVNARGLPLACRTVATSGSATLDAGTCAIIRSRARYPHAASGAQGARYAVASVRWSLE